ncbi:MAG TPA: class I SAM-dependent methyltransferase [Mycobacteriales bacterium]|nr:class I SAM-dependent methyltransferase [Mycobacteriales bacterium]
MDLTAFQALASPPGRRVLAAATALGAHPDTLISTATALRRDHPPDLVAAALTQVRLRTAARARFGPDADRMFFTPDGLEQATRPVVAAHRAGRFAAAGAGRVTDLGCGIGGDLVALARAGMSVHGVDRDPLTVAVARANADALGLAGQVRVEPGDVREVNLTGVPAAFCDPARRSGGRRVFDPAGYSPPFDFLPRVAAAVPLTGAKVAPGIPHDLVPTGTEAEWVSVAGEVKEAALWWGALATTRRRATLLPSGATMTDSGGGAPPVGPVGRWLYEPDGAVIRAHLVGELAAEIGGWLLDRTIAYLSIDTPVSTPFARGYEVTDVMPFSLKRLRTLLRARGVGSVTVKKRGSAVDPDVLRRGLRLSGDEHATVVLTRVAAAPTVLLCRPA